MITEFGKYLRKLRIDHGEILMDMAEKLGVSPSFLSAVEVGKKNVPVGWVQKIASDYSLPSKESAKLHKLAEISATSVKLNLTKAGLNQRESALVFARDFETLSDDDAREILEFFHKRRKEG